VVDDIGDFVVVRLAHNLDAAWAGVDSWSEEKGDAGRIVACRWAVVPRLDVLLDDVVKTFAKVALADWPHWYGAALMNETSPPGFEQKLHLRHDLAAICRTRLNIVHPWLRWAAERCLHGEVPFSSENSRELQAAQLSLAVSPQNLAIVLCAEQHDAGGAAALVAAGEWFHRVTRAPVRLLVPHSWKGCDAIRRLSIAAEEIPDDVTVPKVAPAEPERLQVQVTPLTGLPHPNSPAEQELFERIMADEELAACLKFNQTIEVELLQKYRVDIVCQSLRIVIEVDGDDHRVSAAKYSDDCLRDYRLMLKGYVILRLPNHIVQADAELAMGRIRDVVRYRKQMMKQEA
jgi:very-short-patch-repair endonuclease